MPAGGSEPAGFAGLVDLAVIQITAACTFDHAGRLGIRRKLGQLSGAESHVRHAFVI